MGGSCRADRRTGVSQFLENYEHKKVFHVPSMESPKVIKKSRT